MNTFWLFVTKKEDVIDVRTALRRLDLHDFVISNLNYIVDEDKILLKSVEFDGDEYVEADRGQSRLKVDMEYVPLKEKVPWHVYEMDGEERNERIELNVEGKRGPLGLWNRYRI